MTTFNLNLGLNLCIGIPGGFESKFKMLPFPIVELLLEDGSRHRFPHFGQPPRFVAPPVPHRL